MFYDHGYVTLSVDKDKIMGKMTLVDTATPQSGFNSKGQPINSRKGALKTHIADVFQYTSKAIFIPKGFTLLYKLLIRNLLNNSHMHMWLLFLVEVTINNFQTSFPFPDFYP